MVKESNKSDVMNEIVNFQCVSKNDFQIRIEGYLYIEDADGERPLNFYDDYGLECGHYVPSNPYSHETCGSYDLYMDYEQLSGAFQSDSELIQFLVDFAEDDTVIDRGDYILIVNQGELIEHY